MRSDTIKKGFERAPNRALLKACGVADEDMQKPFVGVANSFCEIDVRDEGEIERRLAALPEFEPRIAGGWLRRYAELVTSADSGAVLRI